MSQVIDGHGYLPSYLLTHGGQVFHHLSNSFLCNLDAGEWMHGQSVTPFGLFPPAQLIPVFRIGNGPGDILNKADANIHFHYSKTLVNAALHP